MTCFATMTRLTRHARLAFACVAAFGLMAMATPAVHATTISEYWDGVPVTDPNLPGYDANNVGWSPTKWDFVDPSSVPLTIQANRGYAPYNSGSFKALIQSDYGSTGGGLFTDSVQNMDTFVYGTSSMNAWLLARYTDDTVLGESYYYAMLSFSKFNGSYVYNVGIAKKKDGQASFLTQQTLVSPSINTTILSHMTFSVQDMLGGGVQLDFTFTDSNGAVTALSAFDNSSTQVTKLGQVGLAGNVNGNVGRNVQFDNYNVQSIDAPSSSAVPEPASLTLLGLGGLAMFAGGRRRRH